MGRWHLHAARSGDVDRAKRGPLASAGMRVIGTVGFRAALGGVLAISVLAARRAHADEPVAASEPRLMNETGEVTTVIDAFDKDDPFDANLTLGFQQTWKHASIRRETTLDQPGLSTGGFVARSENIASYSQSVTTLNLGAEVGIFRDLALMFRLPLVLNDSRELGDLNGSSANQQRLQDSNGKQLFGVPFKSPSRSGVDYFAVGLNYAIMNQQRDPTKPTWVIGVEGRFGIGAPLHACNDNAVVKCPDPSSPDPNNPTDRKEPGISRAMNSVAFHTIFARRYGYIEPYAGFRMMAEFAQSGSDFGVTNDLKGSLTNHPPLQGTFTMGTEVIPWERREEFQRVIADFRFKGTYVSPGREYSELFDALGSSRSELLTNPNPVGYHLDPVGGVKSVRDPSQGNVSFRGITDQQAYGSFGASASVTVQVSERAKFTAGLGVTYNQSHLVTTADACNPDFKSTQDIAASGPCRTAATPGQQTITGIPNPNHRDAIDLPGHRFSVDDTTIVDLWLSGVVMF